MAKISADGDLNFPRKHSPVKLQQRTEPNTTCSSWKSPNVKGLIFLLLFVVIQSSLTSATPAGQRGNSSVAMVVKCVSPGCAAQVKAIFCDDENMKINHSSIPQCTDVPEPKTICQSDGLAYFSMDRDSTCEFEGDSYLNTITLSGTEIEKLSALLKAKSTGDNGRTHTGAIVGVGVGVVGTIAVLIGVCVACRKSNAKKSFMNFSRRSIKYLSNL